MTVIDKSKTEKSSTVIQDATSLLKADHKMVANLFADFDSTNSVPKKKQIVQEICKELTIHAQIEEEIFYPAVQKALKDHEMVPEALVEHKTLKQLIEEIKGVDPDGEMYDAKVKVLSEYVKHHVKEEEGEMFLDVKSSKLDMDKLGELMANRKLELAETYT